MAKIRREGYYVLKPDRGPVRTHKWRSAEEKQQLADAIEQQVALDTSIKEACAMHNVNEDTYYSWKEERKKALAKL